MRAPPGRANFHSTFFLKKIWCERFSLMKQSICFPYVFICRGPGKKRFLVRKTWQTRKIMCPSKDGWTNKNRGAWKNSPPVSFLCIFQKKVPTYFPQKVKFDEEVPHSSGFRPRKALQSPSLARIRRTFPQKNAFFLRSSEVFRNPDACIKVKSLNFPCVFLSRKTLSFYKNEEKTATWFDFYIISASCQVISPSFSLLSSLLCFWWAFLCFYAPSTASASIYDFF